MIRKSVKFFLCVVIRSTKYRRDRLYVYTYLFLILFDLVCYLQLRNLTFSTTSFCVWPSGRLITETAVNMYISGLMEGTKLWGPIPIPAYAKEISK